MAIDEDKTEAVLRYLPAMRDDPGRFVEGDGFVPFIEALYGAGLVVEFDWMTWTDEAQRYVDDQCLVESADIETIQKLITAHARNDRFCNGHLRGMIMNGHIAAVLTRLAALLTVSQPAVADGLRVCIHRGAHQIGGTCIELECESKRLVLDIGVPLDADDPSTVTMPPVTGLKTDDPSLLGIMISHPHQDHYGLASRVPKGTAFLMGAATERILAAAADFTPSGGTFGNVTHLEDRKPIEFGPFRITPYLMDHSAYDAYAVLVEAAGKKLFYTGDLRGHGRKTARARPKTLAWQGLSGMQGTLQ